MIIRINDVKKFENVEKDLKGMVDKFVEKSDSELNTKEIMNQMLRGLYLQNYYLFVGYDDKYKPFSYCVTKVGYNEKGETVGIITQLFSNDGINQKNYDEFMNYLKTSGIHKLEFETKRNTGAFQRILEKLDKNWKQKSVIFQKPLN